MQQLRRYFPQMPTWVNIESVMIVQPNGKILSQYCQSSKRQRTIKSSMSEKQNQPQSTSTKNQQFTPPSQSSHSPTPTAKTSRHKLTQISQGVIQSSRRLFRQQYQSQLCKLIIDNTLVYYRFKYNVIVIVVVKKFSVSTQQIQQLMMKIFNWYDEKCTSMNIQIKIPNVKIGQYEEGQFKKLQWEIKNQIDEKVSTIQFTQSPQPSQKPKEIVLHQNVSLISHNILARDDKLRQIGEKVFFHDIETVKSPLSNQINQHSKVKKYLRYFFPSLIEQKLPKTRKFKRQLSFMQKSVAIAKLMRIRLLLFYFCLIISLVLAGMVYFGWFRQNEN